MEKFFKKVGIFLSVAFSIFTFATLQNGVAAQAQPEEDTKIEQQKEDFNFIKSNDNVSDFIYDGTVLLYGGIALIAISVTGMIITVVKKPKRK